MATKAESTKTEVKSQVKVVKKQVKKEKKESEIQNQVGEHNGEAEAELTVKLPSKKSAAKTETNVEVLKRTLPDGSIEEVKTTTTKTTVDGRTEIKTRTETKIIPKNQEVEVEEEEEEEEEETDEVVVQEAEENEKDEAPTTVVIKKTVTQDAPLSEESVIKKEERSETTTSKKVVVVQDEEEEAEEEESEEEVEEEVEKTVVEKKHEEKTKEQDLKEVIKEKEVKQEYKDDEEKEENKAVEIKEETKAETESSKKKETEEEMEEEVEEEDDEEEYDEVEASVEKPEPKKEESTQSVPEPKIDKQEDEESNHTEEGEESLDKAVASEEKASEAETDKLNESPEEVKEELQDQTSSQPERPESKVPLREPSIPLEKVEDVEIKPISETISKTHTEKTEIISTNNDQPTTSLSTQTEFSRIENVVTVNRTTKTLDHSYEQITQSGIPTVKTYFPPNRERVSTSPQPARPYQPIYTPPQPQPERRHSLLLERLSTERQMPSDIYQQKNFQQQFSNQSYDQQRQWSQEPQSEVVIEGNVKPSTITNQQWYQQSRKENVIYNNVTPSTPIITNQQWSQPQPQTQPPQVQVQSKPQYQPQPPYQPQPQYQSQPQYQPQPQYQSPPQYQPSYTENTLQDNSKLISTYQQNSYPSFTPTPSNWGSSNVQNIQTNQYSHLNKSKESYQNTSQQYSSSYVPPPWEQDPSYVAPQLSSQTYTQPPTPVNCFSPDTKSSWKPTTSKFSKPAPKSYIPPAPNQSFVKPITPELLKRPGSKTYYSEYERRYITVPESTYVPTEAKFQPQPNPSPQYYYDNNESSETVEPQWRKELREFTEKTQTQAHYQTEQTSVNPPWEEDSKYAKVPASTYTPTPTWSQTLRPQSWRERSFESEYVGSNEWSKTSTIGRGRPLSSYGNLDSAVVEKPRGVSVDRYNPNKYQPPSSSIPYDTEHGPVQAHTLDPTNAPHKGYHNPNVPAYHARASAEPREQSTSIPARHWGEQRSAPIQSRSFKYLQWITGTED